MPKYALFSLYILYISILCLGINAFNKIRNLKIFNFVSKETIRICNVSLFYSSVLFNDTLNCFCPKNL